jgi:tRNA A-37 threonylcarbamoyl transferase component Bud32
MDQEPTESPPSAGIKVAVEGYTLVRELSRGGQAVIYLALQKSTGRKVAIKFLREGPLGSATEKNRMEREVKILAELDHPNIVKVIDRGETPEGWSYFVLEYIQGKILAEYLDEFRSLRAASETPETDLAELLRLFVRICDAINAAHLRGIVHRDLKPSNLLIDNYGEPHILDFGLARGAVNWLSGDDQPRPPTVSGEFVGSLPWASPEQAEGVPSRIDIRSDVYSLGVILYELITGEFPYEVFGKLPDVLEHIRRSAPRPPSEVIDERLAKTPETRPKARRLLNPVSPALDAIVLKSLAKKREDRYQSAGDLGQDLVRYLAGHSTAAGQWIRGARRWRAAALTAAGLFLLGVAAVLIWRRPDEVKAAAALQTRPEITRQAHVYGYRMEGPEVVFEFDPSHFDVVRMPGGGLGRMAEVHQVASVVVAGMFNDWEKADRPAWSMKRVEGNRFELRKPLTVFKDRAEWSFKFLVNDAVWVGAPEKAINKEVVVEDTATFNLLLRNPHVPEDPRRADLTRYRRQIDAAWPGQGAHLAIDQDGRYHFTFTHLPERLRVTDLEPLRHLPLTSLNMGETKVSDFSPLRDMATLELLVWNDSTYGYIMGGMLQALSRNDLEGARRAVESALDGLMGVPAFRAFGEILLDSADHLRALREEPETIPARAKSWKGRHYAFITTPMSWKNAQIFCEQHGAHLATVTDAEEQEWITRTFGRPSLGRLIWLGGTDEGNEGYWRWVSEERWRFENWTPPEPNNQDGKEHALAMKSDGWWIDADGHELKLPFLMEWNR